MPVSGLPHRPLGAAGALSSDAGGWAGVGTSAPEGLRWGVRARGAVSLPGSPPPRRPRARSFPDATLWKTGALPLPRRLHLPLEGLGRGPQSWRRLLPVLGPRAPQSRAGPGQGPSLGGSRGPGRLRTGSPAGAARAPVAHADGPRPSTAAVSPAAPRSWAGPEGRGVSTGFPGAHAATRRPFSVYLGFEVASALPKAASLVGRRQGIPQTPGLLGTGAVKGGRPVWAWPGSRPEIEPWAPRDPGGSQWVGARGHCRVTRSGTPGHPPPTLGLLGPGHR